MTTPDNHGRVYARAARHGSALLAEHSKVTAQPFAGATVDLWKCFDRVQREGVVALALIAGFPFPLAQAFYRYFASLEVRNALGTGLGESHRRRLARGSRPPHRAAWR